MTRMVADCREMPSDSGCTLTDRGRRRRGGPRGVDARCGRSWARRRARASGTDSVDIEARVGSSTDRPKLIVSRSIYRVQIWSAPIDRYPLEGQGPSI